MRKLLLKNWRDLKAKKAQFITIMLLIGLGVAAYVALVFAYLNLKASYNLAKEKLKLADFNINVAETSPTVAQDIRLAAGVKAVQGRLTVDTGLVINKNRRGTARIVTLPGNKRPPVNKVLVVKGSYFKGRDDRQVLIDKYFADTANKQPGDTITLLIKGEEQAFQIRGIVVTPEYLFPIRAKEELPVPGRLAIVFMTEETLSSQLGKQLFFNDFAVLVKKGVKRQKVINEVRQRLEPFKVIRVIKQEDQPSNFRMREEIRQNRESAAFMPPLILIISSLSLYIAMARLVQSQRGVIGLAKALGYGNLSILGHYLVFALLVAAGGLIFGFVLGWYLGIQIIKLYIAFLRLPFLTTRIYLQQVEVAALLALIAALLGSIVPAYNAARLLPAIAMRADPNLLITKAKVPLIERFLALFFRLPFTLKLAVRNIFRVKKRSLYTVVGLVFSLILTVGTWASFDSIAFLINRQFREVDKWDMVAVLTNFVTANQIEQAREVKGVREVQPVLQIPVKLAAHRQTHETVITAMNPQANFHGFTILKGAHPKTALTEDGLILSQKIAAKLHLNLGDKVKLTSPYSRKPKTVKLKAVSEELLGAPVFVNLKIGRQLVDSSENLYNLFYLRINPARSKQIEKELFDLPGVSQIMVKKRLIANIEAQLEFGRTVFAILLAFALSVAFVITYNTLTTNIMERARELATMRTIGEDNLHLTVGLTLENIFLALISLPIGIYLGLLAATAMFESFSTEAYTLKVVLFPLSYLWVTLSLIIVMAISELPAIRRVFTLNLAEATKAIE